MINKFTIKPKTRLQDWMGNIRKTWCGPYALAVLKAKLIMSMLTRS